MGTQTYEFNATVMWAKVHEPDKEYDVYTVDCYLTDKSWKLYKQSGIQVGIKEGKIGDEVAEYVRLRRPVSKTFKNKDTGKKELREYGPPEVLDENGEPTKKLIGNGSEVTLRVLVFDTQKGKGHQLERVQIRKLVEYNKVNTEDDLPAEEAGQAAVKKSTKTYDLDEDSIPF